MKIRITQSGTEPEDFPWPEVDSITYREASMIKRLTGLRLGEYGEAFEKNDPDMILGLAAVAYSRAKNTREVEFLLDLGLDAIDVVVEEGDEEIPPGEEPPSTSGDGGEPPSEESEEPGPQPS